MVKILVVVAMLLGSLGLGALGACMTLLGVTGSGTNSPAMPLFVMAGTLAVAAVGLTIFWLFKKN